MTKQPPGWINLFIFIPADSDRHCQTVTQIIHLMAESLNLQIWS